MELLALGVSHKTAPVAVRERLAFSDTEAGASSMTRARGRAGGGLISTCNRTELYVVASDPVQAESAVLTALARRADIRPTELAEVMYFPRNCDAARQLYRVASGLESMIVGEAEVQGQVRRAYEAALAADTTGPLTNRLFTAALQTGRRVRSETKIGAGRTSVSTVAVDLAKDVVGHLAEREVLIIGAGETSELTAQALAKEGVSTIFVANRHADRARSLAERFGGTVLSLDHLPRQLESADIVVASTSSPHPIVTADALAEVARARAGKPIVFIDLAVPRDIDPSAPSCPGVTVYDMDDLQAAVARNLEVRSEEALLAERVVEDEIQRFAKWLGQLDVVPTVAALRRHGEEIVDGLLAENANRWESLSEKDRERVEALARAVAQRLLHEPTLRMKAAAATAVCSSSASCSDLTRGRARGETRRPTWSSSTSAGRASGEDRHPRQRAGAGAGASWVAERLPGEHELVKVTTSGDRDRNPTHPDDKARWVDASRARCWTARPTWRCTAPRTFRRSSRPGTVLPARRRARTRATPWWATAPGRACRHIVTAPAGAAARDARRHRGRRTARQRRHAPAQARRWRGRRRRARTRGPSPPRPRRRRAATRPRPRGRTGDARAAGTRGRAATADRRPRGNGLPGGRARRRAGARGRLPLGGRRPLHDGPPTLRLVAWVGAPDGSAWVRDELEGDDPEALGTAVAEQLLERPPTNSHPPRRRWPGRCTGSPGGQPIARQPLRVALQQQEGRAERAGADAVPIVAAVEPAQVILTLQERCEEPTVDLAPHPVAHLAVELVADERDDLGQRETGLGGHQVDDPRVRGHDPGLLVADAPEIVLHGVAQIRRAQEEVQRRRVQIGPLAIVGRLVWLPVAGAPEELVARVGRLRNRRDRLQQRRGPCQQSRRAPGRPQHAEIAPRFLQFREERGHWWRAGAPVRSH